MTKRIKEMTGFRVGRLEVLSFSGFNDRRLATWNCICDCGSKTIVTGARLRVGSTKSCGCYRRERSKQNATHQMTRTKEHNTWMGMLSRCRNPNATGYKNYGGRGISVCERWSSFENFHADMGPRPKGMTLDRIDTNAGYSKENCRWATWNEQANNTRATVFLTAFGETKPLSVWAKESGIHYRTLHSRLTKSNYSPEKALTYGVAK